MDVNFSLYTVKTMGKGLPGSVLTREKLIKDYVNYAENEIKYEVFYYPQKDEYIITFKVPSESNYKYVKPFYYDVVFSFTPKSDGSSATDTTLNNYNLTVYSNMHSFIFNYTYVYYSKRFLINWISRRYYTKLALKNTPEKRNFYGIMNYEKSIYFSYLTIILNALHRKEVLKDKIQKVSGYSFILKNVKTQDDILIDKSKFEKLYKIKDERKIKFAQENHLKKAKNFTLSKKDKFSYLINNA